MAYEIPSFFIGVLPADVDLSAAQFIGVKVAAASNTVGAGVGGAAVSKPSAGGDIIGVVQNNPIVGEAAQVMQLGVSKVLCSGTFVVGAELAVDANGAFLAAVSGNKVVALALESGAAGAYAAALLCNLGIKA